MGMSVVAKVGHQQLRSVLHTNPTHEVLRQLKLPGRLKELLAEVRQHEKGER